MLALAIGGLGLFAAGALTARFTRRSWWRSGLRQLLLGAAEAHYLLGIAYEAHDPPRPEQALVAFRQMLTSRLTGRVNVLATGDHFLTWVTSASISLSTSLG